MILLRSFLLNLDKTSIDILEIGIPYSDPLADGKLISNASFIASEAGITTDTVFELLTSVKDKITKPLVFLVTITSFLPTESITLLRTV